jgi:hypothetical protein
VRLGSYQKDPEVNVSLFCIESNSGNIYRVHTAYHGIVLTCIILHGD